MNENGFISSLEEVSCLVIAFVPRLRIHAIQLSHAEGEISVRGLNHEMVMIIHEAIGMILRCVNEHSLQLLSPDPCLPTPSSSHIPR